MAGGILSACLENRALGEKLALHENPVKGAGRGIFGEKGMLGTGAAVAGEVESWAYHNRVVKICGARWRFFWLFP